MSRRGRRGSSIGSMLVLLGSVAILGIAFGGGFITGRFWADLKGRIWKTGVTDVAPDRAAHTARRDTKTIDNAAPPAENVPALTFYQELTAPRPAPATRDVARPEPAKSDPGRGDRSSAVSLPSSRPEESSAISPSRGETFTVQVAAYRTRSDAERLRDRLGARGLDADVSQANTAAGVFYRVRIGRYRTRAEAVDAAARIAVDGRVETFVATR